MMKQTLSLMILGLSLSGCAVVDAGLQIAERTGYVPSGTASSAKRIGSVAENANKDLTPSQQYYLGRAVSASLLSKYKASTNAKVNTYLNKVGKTLVLASDSANPYANHPYKNQYDNFHFMLLESNEVNAFAAPGGFIFVTKGMLQLCKNEDDLAAVLAHEISHVQNGHAVKSIKTSRLTSLATIVAMEAGKQAVGHYSPVQLGELVKILESSIDDVTQNLVNSGYGRSLESEADKTALAILKKAGYNGEGMLRVLDQLKAKSTTTKGGFFATHPDVDDRISDVKDWLEEEKPNPLSAVRTSRFSKNTSQL